MSTVLRVLIVYGTGFVSQTCHFECFQSCFVVLSIGTRQTVLFQADNMVLITIFAWVLPKYVAQREFCALSYTPCLASKPIFQLRSIDWRISDFLGASSFTCSHQEHLLTICFILILKCSAYFVDFEKCCHSIVIKALSFHNSCKLTLSVS